MKQPLQNSNWNYINDNSLFQILMFDDGNEQFTKYNNIWVKYGKWRGKIALYNHDNPDILIKSISDWKVNKIQ